MSGTGRTPEETARLCGGILDEIERVVVGRRRTLELVLTGILAGGHILLEDLPGLGKTLIARSFAKVLGLEFARIQFTPDMLPSDVVGAAMYDQRNSEMVFRPGPVFTNLLLADEINRTPPKTQAALLEAMGEGQVSVDGETRKLPQPFVVLATDNPIEYEGTYELPGWAICSRSKKSPWCSAGWTGAKTTSSWPRSSRPASSWPCAARWSRSRCRLTWSTTPWRSSPRPAPTPRSRLVPALGAASPWCSWPGARRSCGGGTLSSPTT
jgi:hypothetical protein